MDSIMSLRAALVNWRFRVIAHRLSLDADGRFSGVRVEGIVQEIVANCPVPV